MIMMIMIKEFMVGLYEVVVIMTVVKVSGNFSLLAG